MAEPHQYGLRLGKTDFYLGQPVNPRKKANLSPEHSTISKRDLRSHFTFRACMLTKKIGAPIGFFWFPKDFSLPDEKKKKRYLLPYYQIKRLISFGHSQVSFIQKSN